MKKFSLLSFTLLKLFKCLSGVPAVTATGTVDMGIDTVITGTGSRKYTRALGGLPE